MISINAENNFNLTQIHDKNFQQTRNRREFPTLEKKSIYKISIANIIMVKDSILSL